MAKKPLRLKTYQDETITRLEKYLKLCKTDGASEAFTKCTGRYYIPIKQLPALPYVCFKVPTGGGKTLIATYSISTVMKEYLEVDNCTVLWMVPTKPIKEQTLEALKDRQHPYRQALESKIGTHIEIMDLSEAMYTSKAVYDSSTCIIVTTLSAIRIDDIDNRKIYESNGHLMNHFLGLTPQQKENLEHGDKGEIPYSLANVFRMRRPLVIMDEAHNARTQLSFESLARFNPSAIIEYTATPQMEYDPEKLLYASNVLHTVSASELKIENMIKMPIFLETNTNWKEILNSAINKRNELEDISQKERLDSTKHEYIRPILLIQAQNKSQFRETLTAESIYGILIDEFKIDEKYIRIHTGDIRGLDGEKLMEESCDVKYIITVQALREGWDCSFAYVLCSISDIGSATAAEQLMGRILRLPNAESKVHNELCCAYAYVVSEEFHNTLSTLGKGLIECGFNEFDAKQYIKHSNNQKDIFDLYEEHKEKVESPPDLLVLPPDLSEKVDYLPDTQEIRIKGFITEKDAQTIKKCFNKSADQEKIDNILSNINTKLGKTLNPKPIWKEPDSILKVPGLSIEINGQIRMFEETHFINLDWNILKFPVTIKASDFMISDNNVGLIDVTEKGSIHCTYYTELHDQLSFLSVDNNWELDELVYWFDRNIVHQDIAQPKFVLFTSNIIRDLNEKQNISLSEIAFHRFKIRERLTKVISELRSKARKENYQIILDGGSLRTDEGKSFEFEKGKYSYNWHYTGKIAFNKHYYEDIGELKDCGEEFDCAIFIDSLPEVKYWVRNVHRQPYSFWLQTSTDKFYPDFIVQLHDGRILAVEYKGKHLEGPDSNEKEIIGKIWARGSNGKCLFFMAWKDNMKDIQTIIEGSKHLY